MARPRKESSGGDYYSGNAHRTAHLPYRHRQIINSWRFARQRWSFEFDGLRREAPLLPIVPSSGQPNYVHPSKVMPEEIIVFEAEVWREPTGRRRYKVTCEGLHIEEGVLP
jgi:hypothetical protein